ncbi:MAG: nickel-type superoxide dismutase maturation protease [Acidobacteria bacterium]|nr:MAG: nickel-type superoxide dismutase maturation protease [Acidobacteriota bacterium]REK03171.1 MAG: nickel-type superoxide dismutase maturation protease [Acidobacteriota bacterium]REK15375.1 MAG: nickel-type superoxide dismutase maturation protease [Acidobacteriota bacterium]REK42094.1 MAG: nickel-type superoxide dismutase maturation protease [Acidobacteriota bacterium]
MLLIERREIYSIEGDSMLPALKDGERVLVDENAVFGIGDIVIAQHPFKSDVVMAKRITSIDVNGKYFLVGDNSGESGDSRTFGPVPIDYIQGKVTSRFE